MKKNFDLDAAKRGATVCTAEGQAVRILCYDLKHKLYPIVAAIMDSDGRSGFTDTLSKEHLPAM